MSRASLGFSLSFLLFLLIAVVCVLLPRHASAAMSPLAHSNYLSSSPIYPPLYQLDNNSDCYSYGQNWAGLSANCGNGNVFSPPGNYQGGLTIDQPSYPTGYFTIQNTASSSNYAIALAYYVGDSAYAAKATGPGVTAYPGQPLQFVWSFQGPYNGSYWYEACNHRVLGICTNTGTYWGWTSAPAFGYGILSNFGQSGQDGSVVIAAPSESTTYDIGGVTSPAGASYCSFEGSTYSVGTCQFLEALGAPVTWSPTYSAYAAISVTILSGDSESIGASPIGVAYDTPSTITWYSSGYSSCSISGPGISSTALSGSQSTGALTTAGANLYTIDCGGATQTTTVTVQPPSSTCPANSSGTYPDCICTQSGDTYYSSTNTCSAPSCPANSSGTYPSCSCAQSGYTYNSSSNTCNVSCPADQSGSPCQCSNRATLASSCTVCPSGSQFTGSPQKCAAIPTGAISYFTASPSRVLSGGSTTLSWNTANMTACTVTTFEGGLLSSLLNSIGISVVVTHAEIYTLSCTDNLGDSYSATVNTGLIPQFKEI